MSVQGQKTDAGRRRLLSWNRPSAEAKVAAPAERGGRVGKVRAPRMPRRPFDYAADARPERQTPVAALIPTRLSRYLAVCIGIVLVASATIALGVWPRAMDSLAAVAGPRFARSMAVLREGLGLGGTTLAGWVSQSLLLVSAAVALAVRGIRRHRKDGRQGRHRAWLAMALISLVASLSGQMPLGRLFGTFVVDAGGRSLGPDGLGWWIVLATTVTTPVVLWAWLPLHQRLASGFWLLVAAACWGSSAACVWLAAGRAPFVLGGAATWVAGTAALAIALLTAARGVIREARGEIKAPPVPATTATRDATPVAAEEGSPATQPPVFESAETDADGMAAGAGDSGYTDGSDAEDDYASRPLSKAEKKRLRRMARMGQAA